jgi:hypothetical protein
MMPTPELAACFGIEILGMCKYDPQAPSPSYFTIGDAVAALAFTFAVQQFLKPIYQFRLRAMGIRFSYVVYVVFIGAICTVVAAAVPNVQFVRGTVLGYPVNWEIAGGILIGIAYAVVAIISLQPAIVTRRNLASFTSAATLLLSEATDEDRLNLAKDLLSGRNIEKLVDFASAFERADWHAVSIELEKLKEKGLDRQGVRGRPPLSAFYVFAKRRELYRASRAWNFLQLMSDRDFCRVIITRYSWGFLSSITALADRKRYVEPVQAFVQAIAWQSLIQDEGMLAKEDGYEGFARSRTFASVFFGNPKMRAFEALNGISSLGDRVLSKGFVSRLNIASLEMVKAEIENRGFWDHTSIASVARIYESISHGVSSQRSRKIDVDFFFDYQRGVAEIIELFSKELSIIDKDSYDHLFAKKMDGYRNDAIGDVTKIVCDALNCIANSYDGYEDPAWSFSIEIFQGVFGSFGDPEEGLSPLQQAIAIAIVKKIKSNMQGYYPTLSRIIIALIGPYETNIPEKPGTAMSILKQAIYFELKEVSNLFEKDPNKVMERFPSNVIYNNLNNSLTHIYRGGKSVTTDLGDSRIAAIDLLSEQNLRVAVKRPLKARNE